MPPLNLLISDLRYRVVIGTGGIGSGTFFALDGNHTLGREESRGGRFLDQRDYCKLHIITHYIKILLGPGFPTILIGKVGEDAWGRRLLEEMQATGLDTRHVAICPGEQTMTSVCFLYPDGSGGNLTASDSACNRVDAAFVAQAEADFARFTGQGVALAAPEVPLAARHKLLELATAYGFLRAASFTSGEIHQAARQGLLDLTDLLSINLDEAAALLPSPATETTPELVFRAALERLQGINPAMRVLLTAGKRGSWAWDGTQANHQPAFPAQVASSAGAGDASLAAIIVGLAAGLTLFQAQELASLAAAYSVTSPHTIHPGLERDALEGFARGAGVRLSKEVCRLLES